VPPNIRWFRGALLRLAFNRRTAGVAGILLLAPAVLLMQRDYAWETWATDGVGLILGATGAALLWMAISGRKPDWTDTD
jgi:hypothetical protein